jgi:hypothetical protein
MSAIANLVAFDGAATPVSHTLIPISVTRDKGKVTAEYRESALNVPSYAQVRVTMSIEKLKSGVYKVEQRTVVPVMESISGVNSSGYTAAPKVAYENQIVMTGWFHERSDITGRRLARQLSLNIASSVATSVVPVATGPLPELFDMLVAPT